MKLNKEDIVELEITDIAFGGDGVGRIDDCVVFVPFTITGETVKAQIIRRKKRFYFAKLIEIIKSSPKRVEPFCKYYQSCGGCQYQHIDYTHQLRALEKQLRDIMTRLGGFDDSLPILPMIPSKNTTEYRNRIDLHPLDDDEYGFCVKGSRPREIFSLEKCYLFELQDNFSKFPLRSPGKLLVVRTHSGKPYCYFKDDHNIVCSGPYDLDTMTEIKDESVYFEVNDKKFFSPYSGFFQVNKFILPDLIQVITSFAEPEKSDVLADVYCGVGVFGLMMADKVKQVYGVESLEQSIVYAKRNAVEMKIDNAEFTAETAEVYLRRFVDQSVKIDVCIVDPPRNGLTNKVVSSIKKIRPPKLVYVSCGPATFARDARKFVDAGYTLEKIQPLDLFPHTKHFELVALFTFNEKS